MTELQMIERDIAKCEELLEMREALVALRKNRHFKRVVEEGYLKEEAVRNTLNLDNAQLREASIRALAGIASFNGYLNAIELIADSAAGHLAELRAEVQAQLTQSEEI